MMRLATGCFFVLVVALLSGCTPAENKDVAAVTDSAKADAVFINQPPDDYRSQLLDLAFSGVSEMPLEPHIKNRSRAQLKVVEAALELDRAALAKGYVEQIENWRRWMGCADLAVYFAEQDSPENFKVYEQKVERALNAARELHQGKVLVATKNPLLDNLEDWRYEAVLTRLTEARLRNESLDDAFRANTDIYGELNAVSLNTAAVIKQEEDFNAKIAILQQVADSQDFEMIYYALSQMADVVAEHYGEIDLNEMVGNDVTPRFVKVPVFMRINVYLKFAEAAVQNNDPASAIPLLEKLAGLVDGMKSDPRYYIPEAAKLILFRQKMGVANGDLVEKADSLLQVYKESRDRIVNIERVEPLCSLAELYFLLDSREKALAVYALAVQEGQVNPNSRPRADDLNRICCSMALHGIEPSEALWDSLTSMKDGLGEPW